MMLLWYYLKVPEINTEYKFKKNSLDLSYTIGRSFSFTLGTGIIINGRGEILLDGEGYTTESVSGESIFLNLGIPFFGGEFLIGYRQDNSNFKNYQCQMSGKSVILSEPVNLVSGQINTGIGFLFWKALLKTALFNSGWDLYLKNQFAL